MFGGNYVATQFFYHIASGRLLNPSIKLLLTFGLVSSSSFGGFSVVRFESDGLPLCGCVTSPPFFTSFLFL